MDTYSIDSKSAVITCGIEISPVNGYSASRITLTDLNSNTPTETLIISQGLTGNLNAVKVGVGSELKNKRISFMTNVELFDIEDEAEAVKKRVFASYILDGGADGKRIFTSPIMSSGKTSVSFLMQVEFK